MTEASNDSTEADAERMTKAHFQAVCDVQYRGYIMDPVLNKTVRLMKEAREYQRQIEEVMTELRQYDQMIGTLEKYQDNFHHKFGFCHKSTRTVGVYVNITSPDDKAPPAVDTKPNPVKQPVAAPISIKQEKGTVASATLSQGNAAKPGTTKRAAVDFVDLTDDDERSKAKQLKTEESASKSSDIKPKASQLIPKQETNVVAMPVVTTLSQVVQIGAPAMQFAAAGSNSNAASLIGLPKTIATTAAGGSHPQRITYVLSPNVPLGIVPKPSVPSGKPAESVKVPVGSLPPPGTVVLTTRPSATVLPSKAIQSTPNVSKPMQKKLAPLPEAPKPPSKVVSSKDPPPKPSLKISRPQNGIVLTWNLSLTLSHEKIKSYQLYGYEDTNGPVDASTWKKVGEVNALPLPMACTLTQFAEGRCYHFIIRAVDIHSRVGPFSDIATITLHPSSAANK